MPLPIRVRRGKKVPALQEKIFRFFWKGNLPQKNIFDGIRTEKQKNRLLCGYFLQKMAGYGMIETLLQCRILKESGEIY